MRKYIAHAAVFAVIFAGFVGYSHWWQAQVAVEAAAAQEVALPATGGDAMAWLVSGAGTEAANGLYELAGTWGGETYYEITTGEWYLWRDTTAPSPFWVLSKTLGGDGYFGAAGAALPANPWTALTEAPPAPTLSYEGPDDGLPSIPVGQTVTMRYATRIAQGVVASGIINNSGGSIDLMCAIYTQAEPHTLIAHDTQAVPSAGREEQTVTFALEANADEVLALLWTPSPNLRAMLLYVGYEVLNWSASWPTPQQSVTVGQITEAPSLTATDWVAINPPGVSRSAYSTLRDIGDVVKASAYTALQRVEATFASAYGATARPHVYARSSYSTIGPVTGEFETAYSTRGERTSRTFTSAYSVGQRVSATFASGYTTGLPAGITGGGLLLLLDDDD